MGITHELMRIHRSSVDSSIADGFKIPDWITQDVGYSHPSDLVSSDILNIRYRILIHCPTCAQ